MATQTAKSRRNGTEPATLSSWKQRAILHGVTLPSGMVVDVRQLTLETHLTYGKTPDALRLVSIRDLRSKLNSEEISQADRSTSLAEYVAYTRPLLVEMLVSPTITEDELSELPEPDIEMLLSIANRAITEDAAGRALGVEPLNRWEIFRHEHECPDDCPGCAGVRDSLSTAFGG